MFYPSDIPTLLVMVGLALGLTLIQRKSRLHGYLKTAALFAGYPLEAYQNMLQGGDDWSETVLRGISRHQSRLLLVHSRFFMQIKGRWPGTVIETTESVENLLNAFFFACAMGDTDRAFERSREINWLCQRVHSLSFTAHFTEDISRSCQQWVAQVEEWRDITFFLWRHYNLPNFRSMNL